MTAFFKQAPLCLSANANLYLHWADLRGSKKKHKFMQNGRRWSVCAGVHAVLHLYLAVLRCSGWMREMSNNLVLEAVVS